MSSLTQIQLVSEIAQAFEAQNNLAMSRQIQHAQHFAIEMDIFKAAARFTIDMIREDECFTDSIAKPPAPISTLRIGAEPTLYFAQNANDKVELVQLTRHGVPARRYAWRCGTNEMKVESFFEPNSEEVSFTQGGIALTLPMMLALINSPKLIQISGDGARQERRRAQRIANFAVDAWHKVSWRTAAGRERPEREIHSDGPKLPLHYRRGHLRSAQEHYEKAFATKLTNTGWGQWIDGQWVGHPSLGIKRSKFTPKLDQAGFSKFVDVQRDKG